MAWCADGDTLRSFGDGDGTISHWNVVDGQRLTRVSVPPGRTGQFSSEGKLLAIAATVENQPQLLIHDARSGERIQTVMNVALPGVYSSHSAFSPDASRVALTNGGSTDGGHTLEIVDLRQNEVHFKWKADNYQGLSWSPDGRLLAAAGQGESSDGIQRWGGWVYVLDTETGQRVMKVQHGTTRVTATRVTWSPDGKRLVSGNQSGLVEVWEIPTGRRMASAKLHTAAINALAWSGDGRRVASASGDGTVRVWDPIHGEELLKLDVPQSEVRQLGWSPNGRRLAAAARDGAIHVWNAANGYEYAHSETFFFEQVHDRLSQTIQLWDAGREEEARTLCEQIPDMNTPEVGSLPLWVGRDLQNHARTAITRGELQDAIASYRLLTRLYRDDAMLHNNFAWLLATCPDPKLRDAAQAVQVAQRAVKLAPPSNTEFNNTLGVCLYRAGDWKGAIRTLEKSIELGNGGNSFDWFFLAMAHWQLGKKADARRWYDQAVAWMGKNQPQNEELRRFGAEAAALLGVNDELKSEK